MVIKNNISNENNMGNDNFNTLAQENEENPNNNGMNSNVENDMSDNMQPQKVEEHYQKAQRPPGDVFFGTNHQNIIEKQNFRNKTDQMRRFNMPNSLPDRYLIKNKLNQRPLEKLNSVQRIINTGNTYGNANNVMNMLQNSNRFKNKSVKPFLGNIGRKSKSLRFKSLF